jgi:hypothetical protein
MSSNRKVNAGGGHNTLVITLSENEERLVEALRALPPHAADQVITWTTRLRELSAGKEVDWSDTWMDEDLADAQRARHCPDLTSMSVKSL